MEEAGFRNCVSVTDGAPSKVSSSELPPEEKVVPGELTIVRGVPNSGKSEWIDALLCNLSASVGWKFALCSMESEVREHARKLLEKHIKKPFFDKWTETEYVSQLLTKIKRFAQLRSCRVWFVAHPRQVGHVELDHAFFFDVVSQTASLVTVTPVDRGPPNLYDLSGSAHFVNKCDNGIVIDWNRDPEAGEMDQVQVCVRKVRNKVAGTIGDAFLSYGRYVETLSIFSLPPHHICESQAEQLVSL